MTDPTLVEVLNELEARELPLLTWGVTSGAYAEDEILALLEELRPGDDPEDLLERLLGDGLVFERGLTGTQFRTRMAETVRLARSLRQWFHGPRSDWRTARTLVSDMRFLARPRVVPTRDVSEVELAQRLDSALDGAWTGQHEESLNAILNGRSVSEFQARSAERLLDSVGGRGGTCVTAGTGAGKTLAFYLPALTHALSVRSAGAVPRIVAIYPRVELLRDQLASVVEMVEAIANRGAGQLRVGVLYGATPRNRDDAQHNRRRGWRSTADGLSSPILSCVEPGCSGELVWPNDETQGRLLRCASCGSELRSLSFTRNALTSQPPEILFTTTEMVNRHLGAPGMRRLLVGDSKTSPDFILLDEIHTYAGTHGAQVANLLRRWRGEMTAPSHVVGLSATLADPVGFFSQLIGDETGNVAVVAPSDAEMIESGREYFLALRGDPASQTSLLSTTIQTAMLMRRMLDREPGQPSAGLFGSRLFAFTDKLDVVNRLHAQLQDAEGWWPGGVDRKPEGSLALLRARGTDDGPRDESGQLWDAAEELGTLTRPVIVDRTTSQDSGVAASSDVVVATASLEVGFDDPNVGAVLQHKAPRDSAQFLQRRGRAGRDPTMRPWTTVVLSDYGRDRLAFQSYEALANPEVQPTHLPIRNRVILKMQATWWLLDHLSRASGGTPLRAVLSSRWTRDAERQVQIAGEVLAKATSLLTQDGLARLESGLRWSLRLGPEEARSVLFDHPRALATTVLPTLIRQLEAVVGAGRLPAGFVWSDPLLDFVPSSLFAPLQTPEVQIELPEFRGAQPEPETEPIAQSMREFAPGRVSYRFALGGKRQRMWVAPPGATDPVLDVETFCSDLMELTQPPGMAERVVQPRSIRLTSPAPAVPDSSYGRWDWEVFFRSNGEPLELDLPVGSPWATAVRSMSAMTHRARAPLTVWRVARTLEVERQTATDPPSTRHRLQLDGSDAAIGFAMEADGIRLDVELPQLPVSEPGTELDRALRTTYFHHLVLTDPVLVQSTPSSFLREWLAQLALCAVVTASTEAESSVVSLSDPDLAAAMVEAARVVFGAEGPSDDPDEPSRDPGLVADVEGALHDGGVVSALQHCLASLGGTLPKEALTWVHLRYASTVAAGVTSAVQALCPDLDVEDLRADCELMATDHGAPFACLTITEDQPGGTGVIETAVDRIVEDPRAFWALVTSELGPCDGERIDATLRRFLRARSEGHLTAEVDRVRAASTLAETTESWASLREQMFRTGIDADQTVISALATRLVRPDSDGSVERLSQDLLDRWDDLERRLGLEVGLRVFAYIAAQDESVRRPLATIAGATDSSPDWHVGQLVGLLWPRGSSLRASSLQNYNPYDTLPDTERLLVQSVARAATPMLEFETPEWRERLDELLSQHGSVAINCVDEAAAADALHQLMTIPTAVGVLEFHPRVVGVERSERQISLAVEIREARQ